MPLKLIPPGKRKGNPFYIVRGTVGGREYEVSTETRDATAAEIFMLALGQRILEGGLPAPGEVVTFRQAAMFYSAFKSPPKSDQTRIDRLVAVIDNKAVGEVGLADLSQAAAKLYPGRKNETLNRGVIKPGAAILHFAADNKWCSWLRIKKFDEAPVVTRAAGNTTERVLLAALEQEEVDATLDLAKATAKLDRFYAERKLRLLPKKRLLILWLFRHWNRISDPLRIMWPELDLNRRTYLMLVGKGNLWKEKPLDDAVFEILANEPNQSGYLFPWRTRSGVYKWLRPLTKKLRVKFTPHMARHYGGKQLNRIGAGIKTVMGALDQSDPASAMRYMDADIDIVRDAMKKTRKSS